MTVDDRPEPLNLPAKAEGGAPRPSAAIAAESVAADPWDGDVEAAPSDGADSNWPDEPEPIQGEPIAVNEPAPDPAPLQLPEPRRPGEVVEITLEAPRTLAPETAIALPEPEPIMDAILETPAEISPESAPADAAPEPLDQANPTEPPDSTEGPETPMEDHSPASDGDDNGFDDLAALRRERDRLQAEIEQTRADLGRLVQTSLSDLDYRRQRLIASIEKLERRRDRIRQEMQTTFAGASQTVAARVQGFKDYLVGSLQELVEAAEELQLLREPEPAPSPVPSAPPPTSQERDRGGPPRPQFAERTFQDDNRKIQQILDRYRNRPDYYGPPWRLRRTFEAVHGDRVSSWFFDQGGRGAVRALGSRLQNILVAAAAASILRALYGDRLHVLVLSDTPERLGDWRRGLQDCLGISRSDFGPDRGVTLFDAPDPLAQKAARIQERGDLPFIIIDEGKGSISLTLLQFPLWLAIAPDPQAPSGTYDSFYER
ncbi:MAG: hypothetical protein Fur0042_14590 [Cyanophyceae cyanobacterium]